MKPFEQEVQEDFEQSVQDFATLCLADDTLETLMEERAQHAQELSRLPGPADHRSSVLEGYDRAIAQLQS